MPHVDGAGRRARRGSLPPPGTSTRSCRTAASSRTPVGSAPLTVNVSRPRDWTNSTLASGTRWYIRQPCRARRAGSDIKVRGGGGAQSRSFGRSHRAVRSGLLRSFHRFSAFQVACRRCVSLAFSAGRRLVALRDLLLVVQQHAAQRPPEVFGAGFVDVVSDRPPRRPARARSLRRRTIFDKIGYYM